MTRIKAHIRKVGRSRIKIKAHNRKTKRRATPSRYMPKKANPTTLFLEELSFWKRQADSGPKTARPFAETRVSELETLRPRLSARPISREISRRSKAKKGVPKRDGSGRGTRKNKGRGGCKVPRKSGRR